MQHLRWLCGGFDVKQISFDSRFFDVPAQMLVDEGLQMIEVPQSLERMTPAIGAAYDAIKNGQLSHDGDELFAAHVLAAVARFNERGFTLSKGRGRDRIDAAVALALAVHRSQAPGAAPHPTPSVVLLHEFLDDEWDD